MCGERVLQKSRVRKHGEICIGWDDLVHQSFSPFPFFSQSNFHRTTQAMKKSAVFAAFAIKGSFGLSRNYDSPPRNNQGNVDHPPVLVRDAEHRLRQVATSSDFDGIPAIRREPLMFLLFPVEPETHAQRGPPMIPDDFGSPSRPLQPRASRPNNGNDGN